MEKIPAGTEVVLSTPFTSLNMTCTVLAHVPEYDTALCHIDGDTDAHHVRRFSARFVKVA